jgi:hypothetical protein
LFETIELTAALLPISCVPTNVFVEIYPLLTKPTYAFEANNDVPAAVEKFTKDVLKRPVLKFSTFNVDMFAVKAVALFVITLSKNVLTEDKNRVVILPEDSIFVLSEEPYI